MSAWLLPKRESGLNARSGTLERCTKDRNIPHDIVEVPKLPGTWEANTMAKPAHLLAAMDRHPDKVIVLLDVDCRVLGDLTPLAGIEGDVEQTDLPAECFELLHDAPTERRLCRFGNAAQGKIDLLLWGDSHAPSLFSAVRKYAEDHGLSLAFAGRATCPPLFEMAIRRSRGAQGCTELNRAVGTFIRDNDVSVVILVARWSAYANYSDGRLVDLHGRSGRTTTGEVLEDALRRTLDELKHRAVVIVEQVPEHKAKVPNAYLVLTRLGGSLDTVRVDRTTHVKRQRAAVEVLDRTTSRDDTLRIDPASELCASGTCVAEADGKLLYFDTDHLNIDGSLFPYPLIAKELDRFLATRHLGRK
jgi:hypothetical protein